MDPKNKRDVLLQFAGIRRNARGNARRPGLVLATELLGNGRAVDRTYVLCKDDSRAVADALVKDINIALRAQRSITQGVFADLLHMEGALPAHDVYDPLAVRPHVEALVDAVLEAVAKHFKHYKTDVRFIVSTLSGTTALWCELVAELDKRGLTVALATCTKHPVSGASVCLREVTSHNYASALDRLKALPAGSTVLLRGPTGSGKSRLAGQLHEAWSPDVPIQRRNCAGIPEALLESELFGHVKGAFTGAIQKKPGAFAAANNGVVFLDEIGDMPLALQSKLLVALELKLREDPRGWERRIYPVGSNDFVSVNVRVVFGTHRDLTREVREGRFRMDLLGRISTHEVQLDGLADTPHWAVVGLVRKLREQGARYDTRRLLFEFEQPALQEWIAFAYNPDCANPWAWSWRDVDQVAERWALEAALSDDAGEPFRITLEMVRAERARLSARWEALSAPSAPEAAPSTPTAAPPAPPDAALEASWDPDAPVWDALRKDLAPGVWEGLSWLDRCEAWALWRAKQSTASDAAAWRWLQEQARGGLVPGTSKNASHAFAKRRKRFPMR